MSWFGNSIVIFVLYKQRAVLQPTDYLTFNLAISDASISVFGYSRGIIEIFNVFRDDGFLITSIWTCQVRIQYWWVMKLGKITTVECMAQCSHNAAYLSSSVLPSLVRIHYFLPFLGKTW